MKTVEKHALWLRLVHWFNVPLLLLMMWSGILIYWANDVYGPFFPQWFYKLFHIDGRLAEGMYIHFFIAWFFIVNGCLYLISLFVSGHWRELFPNRETPRWIIPTILHDMGIKTKPLPREKFNAMQKLAYSSAIAFGILGVLTGFAIYKPVQLGWLTGLFGGYEVARGIHFLIMLLFTAFIGLHVVQVIRAGWNNFRAMIAGFEVEDEH
jgi:thiosulfate reductase cytochrome b subunit